MELPPVGSLAPALHLITPGQTSLTKNIFQKFLVVPCLLKLTGVAQAGWLAIQQFRQAVSDPVFPRDTCCCCFLLELVELTFYSNFLSRFSLRSRRILISVGLDRYVMEVSQVSQPQIVMMAPSPSVEAVPHAQPQYLLMQSPVLYGDPSQMTVPSYYGVFPGASTMDSQWILPYGAVLPHAMFAAPPAPIAPDSAATPAPQPAPLAQFPLVPPSDSTLDAQRIPYSGSNRFSYMLPAGTNLKRPRGRPPAKRTPSYQNRTSTPFSRSLIEPGPELDGEDEILIEGIDSVPAASDQPYSMRSSSNHAVSSSSEAEPAAGGRKRAQFALEKAGESARKRAKLVDAAPVAHLDTSSNGSPEVEYIPRVPSRSNGRHYETRGSVTDATKRHKYPTWKNFWTPEQDAKLLEMVSKIGKNWIQIAAELPGRTASDCDLRWKRHVDPELNRGRFTEQEDGALKPRSFSLTFPDDSFDRLCRGYVGSISKAWKSVSRNCRSYGNAQIWCRC